jgi:choline kinase
MKVVFLAAGSATRLRPLTDDCPKSLLPVAGEPILRRALRHLQALGLSEYVFVTGYREEQIHRAVNHWFPALRPVFVSNPDYATTNNGYSLLLARPHVDGEEFLLLDADVVFEREVAARVIDHPHPDCLALKVSPTLGAEEMKVQLDERGVITKISKEIDPKLAVGENAGIQRFGARASTWLFRTLEDRVKGRGLVNEWSDSSVQQMIDDGYGVHPVGVGGWYCAELDTPADLQQATMALLALDSTR